LKTRGQISIQFYSIIASEGKYIYLRRGVAACTMHICAF